jgi:hypothetical protein
VFLRPNGTNLALAGAAGAADPTKASALKVALADVAGTLVYLLLIHRLGAHALPG